MNKRLRATLAVAVLAGLLGVVIVAGANAHHQPTFDTARPAQLVSIAPGVVVDPILSVGDIVGGYQMSGIPDGLGAFKSGHDQLNVLMNHEFGRSFPFPPANTTPPTDARISKITIDRKTRRVVSATYLFTGAEGFERFCSSTLEVIKGTPYYFTGEEAIPLPGQPPGPAHDGSSIIMNAETGTWTETPWFGHFQHENVTPVLKLSDFMVVSPEDDFRSGTPSHLYAYIADTFEDALSGDPAHGSLYVWAALDTTKTNLVKGETVPGHFVPLTQAENANSTSLKAAAVAHGAFRFARLEDSTVAYQTAGRVYFADTGKPGEKTLRGRVYQLDIDPSDPTSASLTLLLDGDTGDDMANPDNMAASPQSLMIQEDRENPFRVLNYSRILRYDFNDQSLTPVARVNTPPPLTPGTWESSGIIWAGNLLGDHWWLTDVQAHGTFFPQPGLAPPGMQPVPNSSPTGEDGQFQALFVPKS
jgi:hypothetical protein